MHGKYAEGALAGFRFCTWRDATSSSDVSTAAVMKTFNEGLLHAKDWLHEILMYNVSSQTFSFLSFFRSLLFHNILQYFIHSGSNAIRHMPVLISTINKVCNNQFSLFAGLAEAVLDWSGHALAFHTVCV